MVIQNDRRAVIGGDFNAKSETWGSKSNNRRGEIAEDWAATHDLRLINSGNIPTCVRPQGVSIVDLTWVTPLLLKEIANWRVLEDEISYSDHRYIRFTISSARRNDNLGKACRAWNRKQFDEDRFEAALEWLCADENPPENAEDASQRIDSIMKQACDLAMPRTKNRIGAKKSVYWWNDNIQETRKQYIIWYRKWKREIRKRNENGAERASDNYHRNKKELRRAISQSKKSAWRELLTTIDEDS